MIKKINKLKDFGIFYDFLWNDLEEFKKFNLIYGWNYSGKTTLSRVFAFFQRNELHKDYENATFEFELEDGSKYSQSQTEKSFAIHVFNSDYIRKNLKWEEGIEPVLLVGEDSIKFQDTLKELEQKLTIKVQREKKLWSIRSEINGKIEGGLTDKAREVRNILSLPNFEKPQFRLIVEEVKGMPQKTILSDEQIKHYIQTYQSNEKMEEILEIAISLPDIEELCDQTKDLLQKTAVAKIIERLKGNSDLEKWVKDGLKLHENGKECQFCGKILPENLFDKYNAHFSEAYKLLMIDIEQLITNLKSQKFSLVLPDKARFYSDFRDKYEKAKGNCEAKITTLNLSLNELITELENKKTKLFEPVILEKTQDETNQLQTTVGMINELIQKHNGKTGEFEAERNATKDKLIKHWASKFVIDVKYSEMCKKVKRADIKIGIVNTQNKIVQAEINEIEQKLSEAAKGAGKISDCLRGYFGTDEIEMIVAGDDKRFKLVRSGHEATNLSEGERTAIAFSHFMVKLEEGENTLSQTIVFIDDPVSSLDCNHLYHTYSFINNRLADCKQLFVSTHNFEFFNLIKEWFRNKNNKVKRRNGAKDKDSPKAMPCEFYMVKNFIEADKRTAKLHPLEETLRKFKSEYHFLFDQLYKFKDNDSPQYKDFYIIGNIARRFLEIFTNFKVPSTGDLQSKFKVLEFNQEKFDATKQGKVYKLVQVLSHGFDPTSAIEHKDKTETLEAIKIMLDMVEDSDKKHFEVLKKAINIK